jgi:hypothetical protein
VSRTAPPLPQPQPPGAGRERRWLETLAKLLVSGGLIWYLVGGLDWQELAQVFAGARLGLFVGAVLVFVVSNCLGAAQWWLLLRAQGLRVTGTQALVYYFVGVFFNNLLLGNLGGDAMRIYDIRRLTGQSSAGVAATLIDRFVGLISTCTLALAVYPLVTGVEHAWVVSVLGPIWLTLLALVALGLSRRLSARLEQGLTRFLPAVAGRAVASLLRAVVLYRHRPGLLAGAWTTSLAVQFARILVYYLAGRAVGMETDLLYFVCFQPVAAIVAALPISVGGLGVREGTLIALFGGIGVAANLSLAMSLLGYLAGLIASLVGGVAFVARRVDTTPSPVSKGA